MGKHNKDEDDAEDERKDDTKDDGKHNIGDDKATGKQPGDINPRDYEKR
ncbi:MAG: hypothetical protein JO115_24750 [Pseudonocardiales bacterium]|nr:hypothetical protein [Pseudonocardiales bacterium]